MSRDRSDTPEHPQYVGEVTIHDVQVNGPVTAAEPAFRFPHEIGVANIKKNVIDVFYIWGDAAPAMTLTVDQYNELRRHAMLQARGHQPK